MSVLDKVKSFLSGNKDKVDKGIDKTGDVIDDKTGGKYTEKIEKAEESAKKATDKLDD